VSVLNKDVLSGSLFVLVGAAGLWLGQDYNIGTAFRMGPGYFPRVLCGLLVLIGAIIAIKGVIVGGERPDGLHFRPLIMITLAVLTFAVAISTVGLLPAAAAVVLLGTFGGPEFRFFEAVLIAIFLTMAAYLIFKVGLSMTMPVLDLSILGLKP
jgi:hypothetical protein